MNKGNAGKDPIELKAEPGTDLLATRQQVGYPLATICFFLLSITVKKRRYCLVTAVTTGGQPGMAGTGP